VVFRQVPIGTPVESFIGFLVLGKKFDVPGPLTGLISYGRGEPVVQFKTAIPVTVQDQPVKHPYPDIIEEPVINYQI